MRWLSYATVFSAISGFFVIMAAPLILSDPHEVTRFQAYWGLFFAITGVLDGVMQETTRAVSAKRTRAEAAATSELLGGASPEVAASALIDDPAPAVDEPAPAPDPASADPAPARRGIFASQPLLVGTIVGAVVAVVALITSVWWSPALLDRSGWDSPAVWLLAVGLMSYVYQAVLSGTLSGLGLWSRYAGLVALDAGLRLVVVVGAWLGHWGWPAFVITTVIGAASWLVIIAVSAPARQAMRATTDVVTSIFARRVVQAMIATGASAALITGFAPAVKALAVDPGGVTGPPMAAIILAVTLTRAPILVPMQRFQSAVIVHFVTHRDHLLRALILPVGLVLGVGVVGAILAWAIGPWIMGAIWGETYVVQGPTLAGLTLASAGAGSLIITGSAALAFERHGVYIMGWVLATCASFALLTTDQPLELAVITALLVGPIVGGIVHIIGISVRSRVN